MTIITRTAPRNGRLQPSPDRLAEIDTAIERMSAFNMRASGGASRLTDIVGGLSRITASSQPQQDDAVPGAPPLSDGDRIASLEARVGILEKRVEQVEEPAPAGPPVAPADPGGPSSSVRALPTATLDTAAVFARFNAKSVRPEAGRRPGQST